MFFHALSENFKEQWGKKKINQQLLNAIGLKSVGI